MPISLYQTGLAFAEGLGLALSPCILPVLPLILGASSGGGKSRPLMIISGFIASFTVFALISRQILAATGIDPQAIQMGSYALLLMFGLVMIVPFLEARFSLFTGRLAGYAQKNSTGKAAEGRFGGFLVGGLIGLVWTPCAGPILAVALLQVIQASTNLDALLTVFAFSIGAGIPMLAIALSGQFIIRHVRALSSHTAMVRRVMGLLIIVFSLFGLTGFNVGVWVAERSATTEETVRTNSLQGALASPYAAPEISGIAAWMNSDPLTLSQLKGKVVLIDFWTYSCINCVRTLPYLKEWHDKYKDKGLVIIGVHAPEFSFEEKPENVAQAIKKFGITYPVALDNKFTTWKSFANEYWPAHYLIDQTGKVVYTHFGEGKYGVTENNIRYLLGLGSVDVSAKMPDVSSAGRTPETYLGTRRAARESIDGDIPLHHWRVNKDWVRTPQYIESSSGKAALTLRYAAKKVFLVMESADGTPISVKVTGSKNKEETITVTGSTLYEVLSLDALTDGSLTITPAQAGLRLYAFTFGS